MAYRRNIYLSYLLLTFCGCLFFTMCKAPIKVEEKKWEIASNTEWGKETGLLNVESILYDSTNQVLYASNGQNYQPGISGFISKISKEGKVEELKWVDSLSRPTGMAIKGAHLYVADVNALKLIDTEKGEFIAQFDSPIANAGLNDVAINSKGEVFVSASFIHTVFKLNEGQLEPWVMDTTKLKWANGLFANDEQVIVVGLDLSSIQINSNEIQALSKLNGVNDFDGITPDGLGGYFLTTVENSGLYHLSAQQKLDTLMEGKDYFGDLTFDPTSRKLFIPRGNHTNKGYYITVCQLD